MSQRPEIARDLRTRVSAEYREMPGLQLTLAQASRLWNADRTTMQSILDGMVAASVLRLRGTAYVRADSGRTTA